MSPTTHFTPRSLLYRARSSGCGMQVVYPGWWCTGCTRVGVVRVVMPGVLLLVLVLVILVLVLVIPDPNLVIPDPNLVIPDPNLRNPETWLQEPFPY